MPLARIITPCVEDSYELAAQLRERGYEVETVLPGAEPSTQPADLEVTLEECTPEEALVRADLLPGSEERCVFIAPGAIARSSVGEPISSMPEFVRRPPTTGIERVEAERLEVASYLAETRFNVPAQGMGSREMAAQAELDQEPWADAPAELVHQQESTEQPAQQPSKEQESYVYEDAVLSPLQRIRFPRPSLRVFSFLRSRIAEISIPRPEFRFRFPAMRIPRPSLRITWPSLRFPRPRLHLPSWRLHIRIPRSELRLPSVPSLELGRRANSTMFWNTAAAFGIMAVGILFVGGFGHRRPALSQTLIDNSANARQLPFAKVSRPVSSATVGKPAPRLVDAKPVEMEGRRSVGTAEAAVVPTGKPAAALASKSVVRRSAASGEQDELIADEVVVRHFPQKVVPPPAVPKKQNDGIKRYSDLD
jgi:hypothetical protein